MLENALLPTYPAPRVEFVDGDGMWLTDAAGRRYLDFAAGIAVVGLGHRHPAPLAAAHAQLDRLWHSSNLYATEPAPALAQKLSDRFGGAQAFFCNSGAEANEAALKYARKATGKPGVIALEQSFHGRTTGSLAVTGQPAKREAFEPLLPGARFAQPERHRVAARGRVRRRRPDPRRAGARRGRRDPARRRSSSRRPPRSPPSSVRCSRSTRCRPAWAAPARSSRSSSSASSRSSSRSPRGSRTDFRSAALLVADDAAGAFVARRPRLDLRRQPRRLRRGGRGVRHDRRRAARAAFARTASGSPPGLATLPGVDGGSRRGPARRRRARRPGAAGRRRRARRRPRLPDVRPERPAPRAAARRRARPRSTVRSRP